MSGGDAGGGPYHPTGSGGVPGPPLGGGMMGMMGLLPQSMAPTLHDMRIVHELCGVGRGAGTGSVTADNLSASPKARNSREGVKAQPRACGVPIAKRSLAELKADEKKTGIRVHNDLPPDFPRGPWVVDLSKPPDHAPSMGCHDGGLLFFPHPAIDALATARVFFCRMRRSRFHARTRMEVPRGADGGAMEVLVLGSQHATRLPRS